MRHKQRAAMVQGRTGAEDIRTLERLSVNPSNHLTFADNDLGGRILGEGLLCGCPGFLVPSALVPEAPSPSLLGRKKFLWNTQPPGNKAGRPRFGAHKGLNPGRLSMTNNFSAPAGGRVPSANAPPVTDLKNKLNEDVDSTREMIKEGSGAVIEKVDAVISDKTHYAAHQVSGVAKALEKVGAELESADQPQVGRYAREVGQSIAKVAERIEGKDLGEMATMVENFGRRQPMAFLGIAALAGLTASRFLIASAKRNDKARPTGPSQTVGSFSGREGHSND